MGARPAAGDAPRPPPRRVVGGVGDDAVERRAATAAGRAGPGHRRAPAGHQPERRLLVVPRVPGRRCAVPGEPRALRPGDVVGHRRADGHQLGGRRRAALGRPGARPPSPGSRRSTPSTPRPAHRGTRRCERATCRGPSPRSCPNRTAARPGPSAQASWWRCPCTTWALPTRRSRCRRPPIAAMGPILAESIRRRPHEALAVALDRRSIDRRLAQAGDAGPAHRAGQPHPSARAPRRARRRTPPATASATSTSTASSPSTTPDGHRIGDEVLVATAGRLGRAAPVAPTSWRGSAATSSRSPARA